MNSLNLKRMHWFWFAPIAAIAMLWAFASIGSSPANPTCESHELADSGSESGCGNQSADSWRMSDGPEPVSDYQASGDDHQLRAANMNQSAAARYSEHTIRMLNELIPMPDTGPEMLQEMESLSLQQRRFERRYGPESVAARSVRFRLRDLHDHMSTGLRYAVENERAAVED